MVTFSDREKAAWLNGEQKEITIKWSDGTETDGNGIVSGSLKITQTLCSNQQLTFGLCSAASFSIGILNDSRDHVGMEATVYLSAGGGASTVRLGKYKIEKDVASDSRSTRTLTGYDALYGVVNADYAEWYTNLDFPMSLREFRDAFFKHVGIGQAQGVSLPNDSMTVEETVAVESLSGAEIIKAICEVNGVFGTLNSDGLFRYVALDGPDYLYPSDSLYPRNNLYPRGVMSAERIGGSPDEEALQGSFAYQDYEVNKITGVRLRQDGDDEGVFFGEKDNVYTISGNFLLFGKSAGDLTAAGANFLTYAGKASYRPAKLKTRFRPWLELGDYVSYSTRGASAAFPILQRTITGITAAYDEYKADGTANYVDNANSVTYSLQTLKSRTLRLVQNVDEVSSKLTAVDSEVGNLSSEIKQTVSAISLTVTNNESTAGITISFMKKDDTIEELEGTIDMRGLVTFTDLSGDGTTSINGANIDTGTLSADLIKTGVLTGGTTGNSWNLETGEFRSYSQNMMPPYMLKILQGQIQFYTSEDNGETYSYKGYIDQYRYASDYITLQSKNRQFIFSKSNVSDNQYPPAKMSLEENMTLKLFDGTSLEISGKLTVSSTKSRVVDTGDFSERLLYCYETPTPMFGDIGEGRIADDGVTYVDIDPVFAETVSTTQYQVFLQPYGDGVVYVAERLPTRFTVKGTPRLQFGWEVKAKQVGYDQLRLDEHIEPVSVRGADYGEMAAGFIDKLMGEMIL